MSYKSFFSHNTSTVVLPLGVLIIITSLALLLLASCSPKNPRFVRLEGFLGGHQGLVATTLPGAPPETVQDLGLTPFSIVVSLHNLGEADVGPGTENPFVMVRLAGIMHNNFGLTPEKAIKTLPEKLMSAKRNFDGTIIPGEISYVSFDNLTYKANVAGNLPLTIRTEVCYDYETKANVKFCMKNDVVESKIDSSICTLRGYKPLGTSGGPIQITSVWQELVNDNTIKLNINIENVGRGIFFSRSSDTSNLLTACDPTERNPDLFKLDVSLIPVEQGTYEINCPRFGSQSSTPDLLVAPRWLGGSSGTIRLYGGAPLTLTCLITRKSPSNTRIYEDMLNIRLRYRYEDFLEVPIIIQGEL